MKIIPLALILLLPAGIFAQVSQWRGPERNGHFPDTGLLQTWPDGGPELLMQISGIGDGFSSAVLHKGTIYITGKKDTMDYFSAISLEGDILWQIPYGRSWIKSYSNSRSTPTLEENRAYLFSGTGRLTCVDITSGKEIWSANVDQDFEAEWHNWGISESILIVDDLVVCSPAGKQTAMVAYNKLSGELIWQTAVVGGQRSYVSPVLYEHNDIRFIMGMTSMDLYAVNPETGEVIWNFAYYQTKAKYGKSGAILTNTPVFKENEIFITTGYDYPGIMLTLAEDGKSVTEKWRSNTLDNHHGHVVLLDGYIYGSNWSDNRTGKWVCLNWDSGEVMWVEDWYCKGSIISADGMLYIYEEKSGNVGLLKSDPGHFELSGTFQIKAGEGPHWAHPSIYEGKLMIRHGDVLMVYAIR